MCCTFLDELERHLRLSCPCLWLRIPAVMAEQGKRARQATPEAAGSASGAAGPSGGMPSPGAQAAAAPAAGGEQATRLGGASSAALERVAGGDDGGGGGGGYRVSESGAELAPAGGDGEEYDPETAFADQASKPAAAPAAAALDWASIKAAAAAEKQQAPVFESFDGFAAMGGEGKQRQRQHGKQREHASPLELPSPHEQHDDHASPHQGPGMGAGLAGAEPDSLRQLVLPPADPSCLFGKGEGGSSQDGWLGCSAFLVFPPPFATLFTLPLHPSRLFPQLLYWHITCCACVCRSVGGAVSGARGGGLPAHS
jgi:hypothetical protein